MMDKVAEEIVDDVMVDDEAATSVASASGLPVDDNFAAIKLLMGVMLTTCLLLLSGKTL